MLCKTMLCNYDVDNATQLLLTGDVIGRVRSSVCFHSLLNQLTFDPKLCICVVRDHNSTEIKSQYHRLRLGLARMVTRSV